MANMNRVILAGNLTRDVELRHTQGGTAIAKFGMAINRSFSTDGEKKESTCFVDLTAFGKQAEVLGQHLKKGSPLLVEGRLEFSSWDDKNGGGKRSKLDVVVENFQFLGGDREEQRSEPAQRSRPSKPAGRGRDEDYGDIPFAWLIALPLIGLLF